MAEFKKFDPYAVFQGVGQPPKSSKVAKAGLTLGGLGALGGLKTCDSIMPEADESPPDLWGEAEEERAAIVEYDSNLPRAWAEAFARLDCAGPPAGVSQERWRRFVSDCGSFLDSGWADRAHQLGWFPRDLFGCDRRHPFRGLARSGLLWQVDGGQLVLLSANAAIVASSDKTHRKFVRLPIRSGVMLAWRLVREPGGRGGLKIGGQPHG